MMKTSYFINGSGSNIRKIENEAGQTFYTFTKAASATDRVLTTEEKDYFLKLPLKDYTFTNMVHWFGDTADMSEGREKVKRTSSRFKCTDKLVLTHKDYPLVSGTIETTLGRFVLTKVMIESTGISDAIGYVNDILDDDGFGKLESRITNSLRDGKIEVENMYKYIDTRDWLGLQMHGVITTSFTENTVVLPKKLRDLKKKLLNDHKEDIENGDPHVYEEIEKQLIASAKDMFKDDVGMDLYVSGARGSIGNNFKNMFLSRGAVKNTITGKYEIITNSLLDGLDIKDIPAHSNAILNGAFPKSVRVVRILNRVNCWNPVKCR